MDIIDAKSKEGQEQRARQLRMHLAALEAWTFYHATFKNSVALRDVRHNPQDQPPRLK
jgi:hypothetical protein